jgi:hypothetical protein
MNIEDYLSSSPTVENQKGLASIHRAPNVDRWILSWMSVIENHSRYGSANVKIDSFRMGLNYATAISRCGAAAHALITGVVSNKLIDAAELARIRPLYKIVSDPASNCIRIVPKLKDDESTSAGQPIENYVKCRLHVMNESFLEDLMALAHCFRVGIVRGEVTILGMLDEDLKQKLQSEYMREILRIENNEHVML